MRKRVLLIDDEEDFCYFVQRNLEATGEFEVLTSYDGNDGIKKVKEILPDLVLLDIVMPGVSGPDVAAELKENELTKGIPLVFLTAVVQEKEVQESSNVIGGWYYMAKPVKINELVSLIKKLTK